MSAREESSRPPPLIIGLLADPATPTEIALSLADALPDRLAARCPGDDRFAVDVLSESFTSGTEEPSLLLDRVTDRANDRDWDFVVALTELPLHADGRRLVTDLSCTCRAALLSLPAVGGLRPRSRTRRALDEIVVALATDKPRSSENGAHPVRLGGPFSRTFSPIRQADVGELDSADLRYVAWGMWGRLRLLLGMVGANQPWRLVPGLSKATAAALATGAIATVNSGVWMLSTSASIPRLIVAMVGSIALMVGWLVIDAHLWQRASGNAPLDKEKARAYNASTLLTLAAGVAMCYGGLYVINLLWALFIVNEHVFSSVVHHPIGIGNYLVLTWLAASVATIGGALGSGLENDQAIRAAAYSQREQQRRQTLGEGPDDGPSG